MQQFIGRPIPVVLTPHGPKQDLDLLERALDLTMNITTGSQLILVANKNRTTATFVNDSDVVIYLRLGQEAALNTGIRLNPAGGAFEINLTNLWKGDVYAIHGGAGNKVLCIEEWETRYAY